jgi:hypothetical protein
MYPSCTPFAICTRKFRSQVHRASAICLLYSRGKGKIRGVPHLNFSLPTTPLPKPNPILYPYQILHPCAATQSSTPPSTPTRLHACSNSPSPLDLSSFALPPLPGDPSASEASSWLPLPRPSPRYGLIRAKRVSEVVVLKHIPPISSQRPQPLVSPLPR